jgi:hypothetical protein
MNKSWILCSDPVLQSYKERCTKEGLTPGKNGTMHNPISKNIRSKSVQGMVKWYSTFPYYVGNPEL